jgi:NTE family protein
MDLKNIENLVFEGGGIKGYAYLQVLRELINIKPNFLYHIKRYAGSSAGAMFATLLCLNWDIDDIDYLLKRISKIGILKESRFSTINYIKYLYRFYNTYGISKSDKIEKYIRRIIRHQWNKITDKDTDKDPTFIDMYNLLKKELIITSTNMNTNKIIYFSHILTPNVPLYKAIIASSCFPGVFKPIKYDFNPDIIDNNMYLLDGGLIVNYPIFVFDNIDPYESFNNGTYNDKTLGLLILTDDEKLFETNKLNKKISGTKSFISNIIAILTKQLEKKIIKERDWTRTIPIYVNDYSITHMELTPEICYSLNKSANQSIKNIKFI